MNKNNALIRETNILLDIEGTLVNIKEPFETHTERAIGYMYDFIQPGGDRTKFISRALNELMKKQEAVTQSMEEWPFEDFIKKAFGRRLPFQDVIYHALEEEYIKAEIEVSELYDDAVDFLKRAHASGRDVYAVANNFSTLQANTMLKKLEVAKFFSGVYVSGDCGFRKPRPGFLVSLCWEYNLKIKDCVMVGDLPECDVLAGKNALMRTVLVDRLGQYDDLKGDLKPDEIVSDLKAINFS